jgi:hypothetical protein
MTWLLSTDHDGIVAAGKSMQGVQLPRGACPIQYSRLDKI